MKKILCMLLTATLLLTVLMGCSKQSEETTGAASPSGGTTRPSTTKPSGATVPLSGIDAAKLLLAEERLNEQLLQNEGDIFENGSQVMHELVNRAITNLNAAVQPGNPGNRSIFQGASATGSRANTLQSAQAASTHGLLRDYLGQEKQDIGNMEVVGEEVVWTDLGEVSNSYEYFLNLTHNIVSEAERCADLIDFVKKNIRIVDTWVQIGNQKYYLSVKENEEQLYNVSTSRGEEDLILCRRYKNSSGKDVYEMYRCNGTSYETRMTYIPGERYEFSENRQQHFIATNTKGYWENYVLGDVGSHYNVSYLILKDDICYTFGLLQEDNPVIHILSADRQTDLFTYAPYPDSTMLMLNLNGFVNIDKIVAPAADVSFGPDHSYANLLHSRNAQLYLTSGTILQEGQSYCDGHVRLNGMQVGAFSYGYGAELMLQLLGTPEECLGYFRQFLSETGLACSRDLDTVLAGTEKSLRDSQAVFQYYQWNGHTVNTEEGIRQAIQVELDRYEAILAYYTAVKDAPSIRYDGDNMAQLEPYMSFAPITENLSTNATLSGGQLLLESLTLTIEDVSLFVKDEPYHVVLALEDSAGAIIHLEQPLSGETKYAQESTFSVTAANVQISLPTLAPGAYRVVAYIATAEGIRSSKVDAVAFANAEDAPLNLGDADLSGMVDANGVLTLTYTQREDVWLSLESPTALTPEAFRQLLCEYAFQYGIPQEDGIAMLQADTYVPLTGAETTIAPGTYRIPYTAENGSYQRRGYVYLTLDILPAEE